MKSNNPSKIKEILASNPGDAQLLREAGIEVGPATVVASLASRYYDLNTLRKDILADVSSMPLDSLEIEPGRYEIAVDFLGEAETALRTFGLDQVGIMETETGYALNGNEASSVDELDGAEAAMMSYAERLGQSLTDTMDMPGAFYYGLNSEFGDGALRLFYVFEEADLYELQKLGANIQGFEQMAEASFDQIMAALETEGCHEVAQRLHEILREN